MCPVACTDSCGTNVHRCVCCEAGTNRRGTGGLGGAGLGGSEAGWENRAESRETKVTSGRLLAGFSQPNRAQAIIGAVSEHVLGAAASLMHEAFLPQPAALAGGAELFPAGAAHNGH